MTTSHKVQLGIHLTPRWHQDPPAIIVDVNGQTQTLSLAEPQWFEFEFVATNDAYVAVDLLNKTDSDTVVEHNLDKAVMVDEVSFFGIRDPRFVWAGVYTPIYPDHMQQGSPATLPAHNYLSWNGQWRLDFTVPVFTWIHQQKNLGWIYK
jgi:hypothetical protein